MSRFKRVSKLAYECFKDKIAEGGFILYYKEDNYIEIIKGYLGDDSLSEIYFFPEEKYIEVFTFDPIHSEEKNFSRLLKVLGIHSKIYVSRKNSALIRNLIPQSPSGELQRKIICSDLGIDLDLILN